VNQSQEDFPDPIKEKATSLAIENQAVVSRKNVIIQLLNVWEALYETYQRQGFGPIKSLWEKEADSLGKLITARTASGQVTGIAKGISDDGALLLQDGQGKILKIYSADIEI
jgi:BirA family biotin operon repressor/biotin-[acetyl-CoA-carboxylase] ligase